MFWRKKSTVRQTVTHWSGTMQKKKGRVRYGQSEKFGFSALVNILISKIKLKLNRKRYGKLWMLEKIDYLNFTPENEKDTQHLIAIRKFPRF